MTTKPIRERLENWGRANRGAGGGGADCMTGLICDRLRSAALGNVYSGNQVAIEIDDADAQLVNAAWSALAVFRHKQILKLFYVRRWNPDFICKRLSIKKYPRSVFDLELWRAINAIEERLDKAQQRPRIPVNNLIPSDKTVPAHEGDAVSEKSESLD